MPCRHLLFPFPFLFPLSLYCMMGVDEQGDFKIRAGEGMPAVAVHKSILAARSGFFRAMLEGRMADAGQDELTLKVTDSCIISRNRALFEHLQITSDNFPCLLYLTKVLCCPVFEYRILCT